METKFMKKIIKLLILGILSVLLVSTSLAGTIRAAKLSGNSLNLTFRGGIGGQPKVDYDQYNRLLYIEFPGASLNNRIRTPSRLGRYVENFEMIDHGSSVAIMATLNKNVTYSVSQRGNSFSVTFGSDRQFTIAIDAGHGGRDPGAQSRTKQYDEKDLALNVAKYLREELQRDFKIVMTRDTDVFIPLSQRPKKANDAGADFFISVHINASTNRSASGAEIFYFSTSQASAYAQKIAAFENSFADDNRGGTSIQRIMGDLAYRKAQERSIKFAGPASAAMARALGLPDRGIHGANFAVLRGFDGPGVLLELGFISNDSDLAILINQTRQRAAAKAVADEVRKFFYN